MQTLRLVAFVAALACGWQTRHEAATIAPTCSVLGLPPGPIVQTPMPGSPSVSQRAPTRPPAARQISALRCQLSAHHHTLSWLLAAFVLLASSVNGAFALMVAYIGVGSYVAMMRLPFSPIDETAHVTYTHYLAYHGYGPSALQMWPTAFPDAIIDALGAYDVGHPPQDMRFYEGFQPPLGYALGALMLRILAPLHLSVAKSFYLLRLLGVVTVGVGLYLAARAQSRITAFAPAFDAATAILLTAAACLTPAYLNIMALVTNDQAGCLVLGLAATAALRVSKKSATTVDWWLLGIVGAVCWLTKMSWVTVSLLSLMAATWVRPKRWREIGGPMLLLILPWYVANVIIYHKLTGTQAHLRAIMPIINPLKTHYAPGDLVRRGYEAYFFGFYYPVGPEAWQRWLQRGFGWACVLAAAYAVVCAARQLRHVLRAQGDDPLNQNPRREKECLVLGCAAVAFAPLLMSGAMTFKTGGWFIFSRYAYPAVGVLVTSVVLAGRALRLPRFATRSLAALALCGVLRTTYVFTQQLPYDKDAVGNALVLTREVQTNK